MDQHPAPMSSTGVTPDHGTALPHPPEAVLPRLYSTAEVCALFNRRPRTIRAWVQAGHLTPIRVGKSVFFTEAAIQAAMQCS